MSKNIRENVRHASRRDFSETLDIAYIDALEPLIGTRTTIPGRALRRKLEEDGRSFAWLVREYFYDDIRQGNKSSIYFKYAQQVSGKTKFSRKLFNAIRQYLLR